MDAKLSPPSYYPRLIEGGVYHCGFASPKSYGAASYLIRRDAGNWLTDSPRWSDELARTFADWGGVEGIFLTHRDDVADAELYARRFGAQVVIHEGDREAYPAADVVLKGESPLALAPDLLAIPTPGHTEGHAVLLFAEKYLFAGDHLDGDPEHETLDADPVYCWWDWEAQTRSVERLKDFTFEWVLPGHGRRMKLTPERMREEIESLAARMKTMAGRRSA
jgi:glyoxylase-like metal-dependent hydrolase (beta-lactamase superfamily II)